MDNDGWNDLKDVKPPQGLKVLCLWGKGDYAVMQRFDDLYVPIPFADSSFATGEPPDFWRRIEFKKPNAGYIKFVIEDEILTLDELQEKYPETYNQFIKHVKEQFKKKKDKSKTNQNNII